MNTVLLGDIPVKLKQSHKARRIIVKVRNGDVELVIPRRVSTKKALKFLESAKPWVEERISASSKKTKISTGTILPVFGMEREIIYKGLRGLSRIDGDKIYITGDESLITSKIKKLLSQELKILVEEIASRKSAAIGKKYKKITVRNTSTRWGSCSSYGNLSFCWRLAFAPREIVEYIVAHEVAHLAELNHSDKFWDIVAFLYPTYEESERWLKKNGNSLHLYC